MRLSKYEKKVIKQKCEQLFGKGSQIYLFGSRTDDSKRGGDIDLFIIPTEKNDLYEKKIKFLVQLDISIGEQKIDLIISKDRSRIIEQGALNTGIQL